MSRESRKFLDMDVEETVRLVDVRWDGGTRGALFVRGLGEREGGAWRA